MVTKLKSRRNGRTDRRVILALKMGKNEGGLAHFWWSSPDLCWKKQRRSQASFSLNIDGYLPSEISQAQERV